MNIQYSNMYSCSCFNIQIETASSDLEKVLAESLNLSEQEKLDSFFRKDIRQLKMLKNITKVQSSLVQSRTLGNWIINCCVNCACEAYAIHREKGASCVLICSTLREYQSSTSQVIKEELELSKVFNIIINSCEVGEELNSYVDCDAEGIIRNIKETMSEFLRKETLIIEENIKRFTEEQYGILNGLKDAAYEEHDLLVRKVENFTDRVKPVLTKIYEPAAECKEFSKFDLKLHSQQPLKSAEKSQQASSHTPKRQKSSPAAPIPSFDAEGLFDFDISDGITSLPESDASESDKEEEDDRQGRMPNSSRSTAYKSSLAKSLPVNIPAFLSEARVNSTDDLENLSRDDNLDIAASIRELAKSVHGDAVFGELPRPRFSTQL